MLTPRLVALLDMSAASAVVRLGSVLYVVADDEIFLDGYSVSSGDRVARLPLMDRLLAEGEARKASKPDFEALAWLPDGLLFVLPSGSTSRRETGVVLDADALEASAPPREVDLRPLYEGLRRDFPELNIEGAAAAGGLLRLLQRGGRGRDNAIIDLDLDGVTRRLAAGEPLGVDLIRARHVVDLGDLDGVALGFTDATPLGTHSTDIAFAAAAEDTDNPYDDGPCRGSIVGVLDAQSRVAWVERIEGPIKIEGIVVTGAELLMVADPDDREKRAPLLMSTWPMRQSRS